MMTKPVKMNKVDLHIREMMLTYPLLYSNRQEALIGIFVGTNYVWVKGEDGKYVIKPVYEFDKKFDGPTDISDLDESDLRFAGDDDFHRAIRAQNQLERMQRLFVAENIDLFATVRMTKGRDISYQTLDSWYFDHDTTVLATAPFGEIDADWLSAIEELLNMLIVAYNQFFGIHADTPLRGDKVPEPSMFSRMPEKFQKRLTKIREWEERAEAQSGSKARMAAFWETTGKDILKEIIDEEKAA